MVKSKETSTLGEELRRRREELGLSVKQVADEISAAPKYVEALEDDRYEVFPAKVYAQGFLKKILAAISLENKDEFVKRFSNEWDVRMFTYHPEAVPLPENRGQEPYLTPRRLAVFSGVCGAAVLLAFFGVRLFYFTKAPGLFIASPADDQELETRVVTVRGKTERESRLTVNGREVMVDTEGNFDEEFELTSGLNTLEFIVQNRFGKETKEVRYVLVR